MTEEINFLLESTEEAMGKAIKHFEKQLLNIRAGKANPAMLGSVMVDYYGAPTPLTQVANINTPDGRTLSVQPWEKNLIPEIEKGIMKADRKSTRLNSSHVRISYAVFCLRKKNLIIKKIFTLAF